MTRILQRWRDVSVKGLWAGALAACVALGTTTMAVAYSGMKARLGLERAPAPAYAVGTTVDVPVAVYGGSQRTVIVFARSTCAACERSKAALSLIASDVVLSEASGIAFVVPARRAESEMMFARDIGIPDARVFALSLRTLRLARVPTVLLVDRAGKVIFQHEGELGEAEINMLAPGRAE